MGTGRPFYPGGLVRHDLTADRVTFEAEQYLAELRSFQPRGPYYLGGYSNGGKVTLVMAARLLKAGEDIPLVVLLDTYGPGYRTRIPFVSPFLYRLLQRLRRLEMTVELFGPWVRMHVQSLKSLRRRDRLAYLRFKGEKRVQLTGSRVQRFFTPIFTSFTDLAGERPPEPRATYRTHDPEPYPGRVALLRPKKQPLGIVPDQTLGWSGLITGSLTVHNVPGYYDSLLFGPRVGVLAKLMNTILDRADA